MGQSLGHIAYTLKAHSTIETLDRGRHNSSVKCDHLLYFELNQKGT